MTRILTVIALIFATPVWAMSSEQIAEMGTSQEILLK
jgi:hypothetical protein